MTLDIEKAFDLVNHLFLITALEKYGFKEDFIKWKQMLIQNQDSCVINGGQQHIISSLKGVPDKAIQFQHNYLYFL